MAESLLRAGFDVRGFDVRPASDFDDFAPNLLKDISALAGADILISVVRDAAQTRSLCFGEQGVFRRPDHPPLLVVSSTLSPRFIVDLDRELPDDVTLVDAPMSGAPHAARDGSLSFMLGGPDDVLENLRPVFLAMGNRLFRGGEVGAGMTLKVLNNYVAASSVAAVRRVYELARRLGVDVTGLRQVMAASSGATWFGDHFEDIDWSRQGYDPANTIGILEKDVHAALDAATDTSGTNPWALDRALLETLKSLEPYGE